MGRSRARTLGAGLLLGTAATLGWACTEAPTHLTVSPEEILLSESGATAQITTETRLRTGKASSTPIIYQSQDPSIASVSSTGLVTATGHGTTMIMVAAQGSDLMEMVSVKVRLPDHLEIRPGSTSCYIGRYKALKAQVMDKEGQPFPNVKIEWTSSNPAVATVKNGSVTGVGEGTTTIVARGLGLEGQSTVSVGWAPGAKALMESEQRAAGGGGGGGGSKAKQGASEKNPNGFTDDRLGIFND